MKLTEKQKNQIKEIIADKLGYDIEEVNDDSHLNDNLCADSLDEVEILMCIEKEFDVEINDEIAEGIKLVSDYYPIIESLS